MRFIHISDLHIGKRMSAVPLEEDQRFILGEIVRIARERKADAALIAGDIYDSTTPANESYGILSGFLRDLSAVVPQIFMIAGNHDSQDKIAYGKELFEGLGIHIVSKYDGHVPKYSVGGPDGADVYLLPFVKPADVRNHHPDAKIESYEDAVRCAVGAADVSGTRPKIIVSHQYVVDGDSTPWRTDSEQQAGGLDKVDFRVFDDFDYVALGHIHGAQAVGRDTVRYCGTPLKYSKSEAAGAKSVTIADVTSEGIDITTVPLGSIRDVRVVRGTLDQIVSAAKEDPEGREDFIYAELTQYAVDAMAMLREVYPNTLSIADVTEQAMGGESLPEEEFGENTDVRQAFSAFYKERTGKDLTDSQRAIIDRVLEEVGQ